MDESFIMPHKQDDLETLFDRFISESIAPVMRSNRFRKRGMTWNREQDDLVHVIDIQFSQWNSQSSLGFTLNVGVLCRTVWELCWGKESPRFVSTDECCPCFRMGQLLNLPSDSDDAIDLWWELVSGEESPQFDETKVEVLTSLSQHCLPLLDNVKDKTDCLSLYGKMTAPSRQLPANRLYSAIFLALTGHERDSEQAFDNFESSGLKAWNKRLNGIKDRLSSLGATG